jgi:hypothetical protein
MPYAYFPSDGLTGQEVDDEDCNPASFTYPAIGVFTPTSRVDTVTNLPCDLGINSSPCLVMSNINVNNITTYGVATNEATPYKSLHGRLSASVKVNPIDSTPTHYGLCVLQSTRALTLGSGAQAYALTCDTIVFQNRIRLLKMNNGISGSPGGALESTYTLLTETANAAFSAGDIVILTLEWESDPAILKGTRLQAWYTIGGNTTKLADLVHTGAGAYAPASPTAGAGVFMQMGSNPIITYFDAISILT